MGHSLGIHSEILSLSDCALKECLSAKANGKIWKTTGGRRKNSPPLTHSSSRTRTRRLPASGVGGHTARNDPRERNGETGQSC